ncbi:DUF4340 domain-containing protein [Thioalkalicoccus limnaeus]|uniref:DUF4340 domain-containing protein n=1 Tax=Thioalkalicoccus limnaeus TaxID=120681 RepID=A0ABV4BE62_9GAMM
MIRHRWLGNLGLLLLVLALAVLVHRELAHEPIGRPLTALVPSQIHSVQLERNGERLLFVRDQADWWMTVPYEVAADRGRVTRLLTLAEAQVRDVLPVDAAGMRRLGLEPPRVALILDDTRLRLGVTDPVTGWRYVGVGERVYLIEDRFDPWLNASALEYLDRRLWPPDFTPAHGTFNGEPLTLAAVRALGDRPARSIVPLDSSSLAGDRVEVQPTEGAPLRFLVSRDGRQWDRVDLRLRYLFDESPLPPALIDARPPSPDEDPWP